MSWRRVAQACEESEDDERKVVTRCKVIRVLRVRVRFHAVKDRDKVYESESQSRVKDLQSEGRDMEEEEEIRKRRRRRENNKSESFPLLERAL